MELCASQSCSDGPSGEPAVGTDLVAGLLYCPHHAPAAKALIAKRRDLGLGRCARLGCTRPASSAGGECIECRAGVRAASGEHADTTGRGGHPYDPKPAALYLVVGSNLLMKPGKAVRWSVGTRINTAAARIREHGGTSRDWRMHLAEGELMGWGETERIEHTMAGRLAHNVGAKAAPIGKEWFHVQGEHDWPSEFERAVHEALEFIGLERSVAGTVLPLRPESTKAP